MPASSHPFDALTPDLVIDAIEAAGFVADGRILPLGSYENRVYQVGLADSEPVVVKFYRPGRWTDEALLEEHAFALELAAAEVPVVAPMRLALAGGSTTLPGMAGFRYAIYPRRGGRWPELATQDDRRWIGRFLGRIHLVGARSRFQHRATLSVQEMGRNSVEYLQRRGVIPTYVSHHYERVTSELLREVELAFEHAGSTRVLRIHGDCHRNNILWTEQGPHFVDLDDCMTGPAVQDLWMLLSGPTSQVMSELDDVLEGYGQFVDFDPREVSLIEPLRSLRMIRYAAWLAQRWDDPAFPRAFPWFGEARYWEHHVAELQEQLDALTGAG